MPDPPRSLDPVQLGAYFALIEVTSLLRHAVEQQLREAGDLSYVQFQLLARLGDSPTGSHRMTDLADGVVYSRSGLTYQAGLLEKAGLVTRAPSAGRRAGHHGHDHRRRPRAAREGVARPHRGRQPHALRAALARGRQGSRRPAGAGARPHALDAAPLGRTPSPPPRLTVSCLPGARLVAPRRRRDAAISAESGHPEPRSGQRPAQNRRIAMMRRAAGAALKRRNPHVCRGSSSGASRARTGDLLHAMQALSQLSYSPRPVAAAIVTAARSRPGRAEAPARSDSILDASKWPSIPLRPERDRAPLAAGVGRRAHLGGREPDAATGGANEGLRARDAARTPAASRTSGT